MSSNGLVYYLNNDSGQWHSFIEIILCIFCVINIKNSLHKIQDYDSTLFTTKTLPYYVSKRRSSTHIN